MGIGADLLLKLTGRTVFAIMKLIFSFSMIDDEIWDTSKK